MNITIQDFNYHNPFAPVDYINTGIIDTLISAAALPYFAYKLRSSALLTIPTIVTLSILNNLTDRKISRITGAYFAFKVATVMEDLPKLTRKAKSLYIHVLLSVTFGEQFARGIFGFVCNYFLVTRVSEKRFPLVILFAKAFLYLITILNVLSGWNTGIKTGGEYSFPEFSQKILYTIFSAIHSVLSQIPGLSSSGFFYDKIVSLLRKLEMSMPLDELNIGPVKLDFLQRTYNFTTVDNLPREAKLPWTNPEHPWRRLLDEISTTPELKTLWGEEGDYQAAIARISDGEVEKLLDQSSADPNKLLSQYEYAMQQIMTYCSELNTPADRNECLYQFSNSIANCGVGKREGICVFYQQLVTAKKIRSNANESSGGSAAVTNILKLVPDLREKINQYIEEAISCESPMMSELTQEFSSYENYAPGRRLPQLAHDTLYIKNSLGKSLGLSHAYSEDPYMGVGNRELLNRSREELITIVLKHVDVFVRQYVKEKINEALKEERTTTFSDIRSLLDETYNMENIFEEVEAVEEYSYTVSDIGVEAVLKAIGFLHS